MAYIAKDRKNEQGVTMVLVAVGLVSVLAMAALAVDVLALYVARSEAQKAADAGALAAAQMFAFTGYTSNQTAITQAQLCVTGGAGSTAAANKAAETLLSQNKVAGQAASLQNITCDFSQTENPRLTVTVQRTGLPVLFGRIWATAANSVSAAASAEAFNPSGGTVPIAVWSVKPWLIPNCRNSTCSGAGGPVYFTSTYGLVNNGAFIGGPPHSFQRRYPSDTGSLPNPPDIYYAMDPPAPNYCPSTGALSCNQVGNNGPPGAIYRDNIACSNTAFQYSCGQQLGSGQPVQFDYSSGGSLNPRTAEGVTCLIHASGQGLNNGQDTISWGSLPLIITGGTNNPNPALQNVTNISRSDSVVTVPVYVGGNACPGGTCSAVVIGFLQLGIQDVQSNDQIDAVIMNASACNPANTGTPVTGGGLSSIPVRLIHQ